MGNNGQGSIEAVSNISAYNDIFADAAANSDYSISDPVSGTYGTPMAPSVVHVVGDFKPTGSFTGSGVLVVEDGDFAPTGPFDWSGLVLVQQSAASTSDVKLMAGATITGGLVAINASNSSTTVPTPNTSSCSVPWTIDGPWVVPQQDYLFQVDVLGSEIQSVVDGVTQYEVPVTAELHVGSVDQTPFGPIMAPLESTIDSNPSFRPSKIYKAGTQMSMSAASFNMISYPGDAQDPTNWQLNLHQDSRVGSNNINVLQDGDVPPNMEGFNSQTSIGEILAPYLVDGKVSLGANQALFLFELAETNQSSSAFDMNDFVAIATLAAAPVGEEVTTGESIDYPTSGVTIEVCPSTETTVNVPSEIVFEIGGDAGVIYSAEAIAKAGQSLQSIRNRTMVVIASEKESQY